MLWFRFAHVHGSSLAGNSDIKETLFPSELVPGAKEEKNSVSPACMEKKEKKTARWTKFKTAAPGTKLKRETALVTCSRERRLGLWQVQERDDRACGKFKREKTVLGSTFKRYKTATRLWQVQEREDSACGKFKREDSACGQFKREKTAPVASSREREDRACGKFKRDDRAWGKVQERVDRAPGPGTKQKGAASGYLKLASLLSLLTSLLPCELIFFLIFCRFYNLKAAVGYSIFFVKNCCVHIKLFSSIAWLGCFMCTSNQTIANNGSPLV